MIRTTLTLLAILGTQSALAATVIHAGFLFDTKEGDLLEKQTITIEGGRVVSVDDGFLTPEGSNVVDLSTAYVSPGFMDMHVHLDGELDPPASYSEEFFMNSADIALRSTVFARRTLDAGFTTVRDLGAGDIQAIFALRDAIAKNIVAGPRIFAAGKSMATTGGHADPTNGVRADLRGDPGPKDGVINGPADAYKAVRQRYKDGSDVVKLTVTGGVLSLAKSGDNPQFTDEELEAVVKAARDYDFVVAVHAHVRLV